MKNRERIIGKAVLDGTLELCSPLLIGSGAQREGNDVDTQILQDKEGRPFIPGTSIAGVLRAALPEDLANLFFGGTVEISTGNGTREVDVQSAIEIEDVVLAGKENGKNADVVARDGVCIDDVRGVAVDEKKYDYELVERGARGAFHAVITLREYHRELRPKLADDVERLASGVVAGFRLGAMTAKGFGHVCVKPLSLDYYDFAKKEDAIAWLSGDAEHAKASKHKNMNTQVKWDKALTGSNFKVDATFALTGSLLVKDMDARMTQPIKGTIVHATMKKSVDSYLVPGPSVKGTLRHHALRILEQLGFRDPKKFLNGLMGLDDKAMREAKDWEKKHPDAPKALRQSRFIVDEVYINAKTVKPVKQTRNRIDRFTGGTINGALFTTEAVWGNGENAPVHIHFEIRKAEAADVGLALLLLKDLSLGRLPLGGEKSIGRGVLKGRKAEIRYTLNEGEQHFTVEDGKIVEGDKGKLEECVAALAKKAKEGAA